MHAAGNMPDHVTRYSHKDQGRWMVMSAPPSRVTIWDVLERAAVALGIAVISGGLVTTAVMILQGGLM